MGDHLRVSVIGAMEIDGEERNGVFLEGPATAINGAALLFDEEVRIVPGGTPPEVTALVEAATALRNQIARWHEGGPAAGPEESRALFKALDDALTAWEAAQK